MKTIKLKIMKKLIVFVMMFVSFTLFAQQPKKSNVDSSKIIIDTLKPDERKYNWYGKSLTRKEYLDILSKGFKKFNDSLRKEQGL